MKVPFRSKNEMVYDHLRAAIIAGDYKPGIRLVIDQLALELGVSQIPIREAMRELESDGFVTIEPYAGASVTELNASFIFEVFGLLQSIEIMTSRSACCRMTDVQLDTLDGMIGQMEALVSNPAEWSRMNKELHLYICECANSVLGKQMMHKVLSHWERLHHHYFRDVFGQRVHNAQREHREILAAFRARNLDQLEESITQHNQNGLQGYLQHLRASGLLTQETDGCP